MMKRKLFIDFDSTIVDTVMAYCNLYNFLFEAELGFIPADPSKNTDWNFDSTCPMVVGHVREMFEDPMFFYGLDFFDNAYAVLGGLNQKYDVQICTIGTYKNIEQKADWIRRELPFIKKSILLCNEDITMDKSMVNMSGGIFIDDRMDNLMSSNAGLKLCFGKNFGWNKDWKGLWLPDWVAVGNYLL